MGRSVKLSSSSYQGVINRCFRVLTVCLLTSHSNLQPFDLKEIDVMVNFPDNYPEEVKTVVPIY